MIAARFSLPSIRAPCAVQLVDDNLRVRVVDFGLSKILADTANNSSMGECRAVASTQQAYVCHTQGMDCREVCWRRPISEHAVMPAMRRAVPGSTRRAAATGPACSRDEPAVAGARGHAGRARHPGL